VGACATEGTTSATLTITGGNSPELISITRNCGDGPMAHHRYPFPIR
jgi:hypothetical protein